MEDYMFTITEKEVMYCNQCKNKDIWCKECYFMNFTYKDKTYIKTPTMFEYDIKQMKVN